MATPLSRLRRDAAASPPSSAPASSVVAVPARLLTSPATSGARTPASERAPAPGSGGLRSRTLFARLFRLKDRALATPTPLALYGEEEETKQDAQDERARTDSPMRALFRSLHLRGKADDTADKRRRVQMPLAVAAVATTVVAEGVLTRLVPQRYWHSKQAFFVLEEALLDGGGGPAHVRFTLRQFRLAAESAASPGVLVAVFALSENDVVTDLHSDRHVKFALELQCAAPEQSAGLESITSPVLTASMSRPGGGSRSLRLAAADGPTHARWLCALSSCIAKLIVQAETHYPSDSPAWSSKATRAELPTSPLLAIGKNVAPAPAKIAPLFGDEGRRVNGRSSSESGGSSEHSNNNSYCKTDLPAEEIRAARQHIGDERAAEEKAALNEQQALCLTPSVVIGTEGRQQAKCAGDGDSGSPQRYSSDSYRLSDPETDNNDTNGDDDSESDQEDNQGEEKRLDVCEIGYGATQSCGVVAPHDSTTSSYSALLASKGGSYQRTTELEGERGRTSNNASVASTSAVGNRGGRIPRAGVGAATSSSAFFPPIRPQLHSFNAIGQVFTLDVRYQLLKSIGNGAYGAVIAVKDVSNGGESLAVKKITNIFEDLVDAKRILREVRLLHHFNHKNITRLQDLAPPLSRKHFEDMYIITELMETDLHQVIYSMQPMSDDHVKYFLYQMLCALHHIHSAGVLHRDMKPSNILLNSNCDLKICDFGLARGGLTPGSVGGDEQQKPVEPSELTEYVVTRWYRAPEIMLNCLHYTAAIDVWAVGCIFAEMLLREPLFPGNDYLHQLKLIIKFLGTPKQEDIGFVKNAKALRFLTKLSISKPKKWRDVFAGGGAEDTVSPEAIDLLSKMLLFNPDKRISVDEALRHPYLATFFEESDLVRSRPFDFSFDLPDEQLSKSALIDLLCEDIEQFHPPVPPSTASAPLSAAASRFFRMGMTASAS
ncbi:hypothetical protein BBJ28_00014807 [Nothophytophthora sp. Chile5]|nr:hypothetical protein BBJ28_00014807 [Nothophytophthora sp. Chile5]